MSYQAVEAVMKHSQSAGSERLLLMVIATHADAETLTAYLGETTLCKEANMKERNLRYTLAKLKASGELQCIVGGGRGRANLYSITLQAQSDKGAEDCPVPALEKGQGVAALSDEKGQPAAGFAEAKRGNPSSQKGQSVVEKGQPIAPQPIEPEKNHKTNIHTLRPRKLPDLSPERQADIAELHSHYCAVVKTVPLDPIVQATLRRVIGEKGIAYCKKVVDGCALDDWPDRKINNDLEFIFKTRERMSHLVNIAEVKKGGTHGNGNGKQGTRGKPSITDRAQEYAEYFGSGGAAAGAGKNPL